MVKNETAGAIEGPGAEEKKLHFQEFLSRAGFKSALISETEKLKDPKESGEF
jgi:hypothetical protein